MIPPSPPLREVQGDGLERISERNRDAGVRIHTDTNLVDWDGRRQDIGEAVGALF